MIMEIGKERFDRTVRSTTTLTVKRIQIQLRNVTHLVVFWMVVLRDTHISFVIDRSKLELLVLGKFLEFLPFAGWIAALQSQVAVLCAFNAIIGIVNPQEIAVGIIFQEELGAVAVIAVANVQLVAAIAAFTVPTVVIFSRSF